jgi:hypothetical protein
VPVTPVKTLLKTEVVFFGEHPQVQLVVPAMVVYPVMTPVVRSDTSVAALELESEDARLRILRRTPTSIAMAMRMMLSAFIPVHPVAGGVRAEGFPVCRVDSLG